MARPPKNIKLLDSELPKADAQVRGMVENLFGAELEGELKPNKLLNANQKKIYRFILEHVKRSGVIGNIDAVMLETTAIAIDRLQSIEKILNEDFDQIRDRELMSAKSKYTADLFKGIEMFGMAPLSRAKFGTLTANKKAEEQDPLLKVLKGS